MKYTTPKRGRSAADYESTLLGSILSLSCIPKSEMGPYEYFNNPASQTKQEHDATEANLAIVSIPFCLFEALGGIIQLEPEGGQDIISGNEI